MELNVGAVGSLVKDYIEIGRLFESKHFNQISGTNHHIKKVPDSGRGTIEDVAIDIAVTNTKSAKRVEENLKLMNRQSMGDENIYYVATQPVHPYKGHNIDTWA